MQTDKWIVRSGVLAQWLSFIAAIFFGWKMLPSATTPAEGAMTWLWPSLFIGAILLAGGLHVVSAFIARGQKENPKESQLPERKNEYERTISNLRSQIERLQKNDENQGNLLVVRNGDLEKLQAKLDGLKWLHELAETQAVNLKEWVEVDCSIGDHQLLGADPYIDLTIRIISFSVYSLTLTRVSGFLFFIQRLREPLEVSMNNVKNLPLGEHGFFTVTQPLRKADAVAMLNARGYRFALYDLTVDIQANPGAIAMELPWICTPPEIDDLFIAKHYPKIVIDIKSAHSDVIANLQTWGISNDGMVKYDGFINLELHLSVKRSVSARIASVYLSANLRGEIYRLKATVGDVWEGELIREHGEVAVKGKKLPNLISSEPLIVDETGATGFVQFRVNKGGGGLLDDIEFVLTLKDESGEEHWAEGVIPARK
jgi:hypothetical protein